MDILATHMAARYHLLDLRNRQGDVRVRMIPKQLPFSSGWGERRGGNRGNMREQKRHEWEETRREQQLRWEERLGKGNNMLWCALRALAQFISSVHRCSVLLLRLLTFLHTVLSAILLYCVTKIGTSFLLLIIFTFLFPLGYQHLPRLQGILEEKPSAQNTNTWCWNSTNGCCCHIFTIH